MTRIMKIGRNAETGEFVPVKVAKDRPKTHVVETIKYEDDDDKRKR